MTNPTIDTQILVAQLPANPVDLARVDGVTRTAA